MRLNILLAVILSAYAAAIAGAYLFLPDVLGWVHVAEDIPRFKSTAVVIGPRVRGTAAPAYILDVTTGKLRGWKPQAPALGTPLAFERFGAAAWSPARQQFVIGDRDFYLVGRDGVPTPLALRLPIDDAHPPAAFTHATQFSWSADGETLMFWLYASDKTQLHTLYQGIFTQPVLEGSAREITSDFRGVRSPTFAPDGSTIAFVMVHSRATPFSWYSTIYRIPAAGGSGDAVADMEVIDATPALRWSPSGEFIAVVRGGGAGRPVGDAARRLGWTGHRGTATERRASGPTARRYHRL
jgi:hypothetical protein